MTLNKKCRFFLKVFTVLTLAMSVFGCAVQQKPQGGPRDRTPPKLLKATPANQTHNFSAKQIKLDFDEYFKFNNQFQEITVFPAPEKMPDFKIKQKSLIITFKDTLQKNTTYVINFGKAIGDVNENNILKNFTYVFSTGSHIDSLSMSGTVINTLTQQREKDVTVFLFTPKQDSLLFGKKRPSIYTTTDTAGNFTLTNLKEATYKIYALKESAPNKIYDNDNELIAFSTKDIHLQHDSSNIQLRLFKQTPAKFKLVERRFDNDGKMFFTFNKPLDNPSVRILYPAGLDEQKIVDINKTRDTLMIYSKNMDFDSVSMAFYENHKPIDTTYLHKGRKENFTRSVTVSLGLSKGGATLTPNTDLHLYFNTPIASADPSLVTLKEDSTFVNYSLLKDTGNTKLYSIKYRWRPKVNYTLTINEGAFTSIYGDRNKRVSPRKFQLDIPDSYSTLTLKVTVPEQGKSYLVELLNDQKIPLRSDHITKNTSLIYRNMYVGKFTVRVIYDDNNNGKWDSGNIKAKKQPESIWLYDKVFTLRPNWEITEDITIPKEVILP